VFVNMMAIAKAMKMSGSAAHEHASSASDPAARAPVMV